MPDPKVIEYQSAVQACALVASLLQQHDLPELLQAIEHSHALGPILDPTLYRRNAAAMDQDKALLEAAMPLWKLGRELGERAEGNGATP